MKSISELFGIELPIIQAPMAGAQGSAMAIAVSNAGGLGSLACAMLTSDRMRAELARIRSGTTRPFNVNFFCHTVPSPNEERERQWRRALEPYYRELGVEPPAPSSSAGRSPFNAAAAEVLEEFEPPVLSFHFGLPSPELLEQVRRWNPKILSSATTVEEALWLEARGVDAIIAQGLEAGGHRGMFLTGDVHTQLGTIALVRQLLRVVKVPVIAAGGIADAPGISAALRLGASGAQLGTAYLLCPEATISPVHRRMLTSDAARVTALTNLFSGRPARGILNRVMRELGPMNSIAPEFPLAAEAIAPLRAKSEEIGSPDFLALWAGQNTSGCKAIPAGELTRTLGANL